MKKFSLSIASALLVCILPQFPSHAAAPGDGEWIRPADFAGAFALFADAQDAARLRMLEEELRSVIIILIVVAVCAVAALSYLLVRLNRKAKVLAKANSELANFNELRTAFIDADSDCVFLKDKDLKYVFANRALQEFYRRSEDEIIGHNDFELQEKDFAQMCTNADLEVLDRHELIVSTTSWDDRYFKTTKFPVRMSDGTYGVGAYVSDVTDEYDRQRRRERMLRRNRLLLDVLGRNFHSKQEQLDYALNELLKLSGSKFGYIFLYDEDTEEFTLNSWTKGVTEEGTIKDQPDVYQLADTSIWGEVVRQRKPIIVNDFNAPNPLKKGYPEGHVQLKKYMSVPVFIDDKIVAVAGFGNKQADYNEIDIYELTMLMSGVWNAMQRRESMETLTYERNKYFQTLLSIGDGVMVIDRNRNIEMLNTVACSLTGWPLEEAVGVNYKEVFALSHEQEGFTVDDPIEKAFVSGEVQELGNHAILTSKNGRRYHLEDSAAPIRDDKGQLAGVVLVFRDVTEKKEQRKKIEFISFHDSLTGLYNRRYFEEELRRADIERKLPISIVMGDVNSLKLTNDIFGHAFGDMLLERVAEVMKNNCRAEDIIARWGGDEFVLLLPRTSAAEAEQIVERIKSEVCAQQIRSIRCSVSMGYDTKSIPLEDIMLTLKNAEAKMYSNKTLERSDVMGGELDSVIQALAECSELEEQHSLRVGALCAKLGRALQLSEAEVERLSQAGRLHDIGKIVLSPSLLEKGYRLNAEEWHELSQHPVVGCRILNYFDETLELAETVLSHHEFWDGSGYPKGLQGEKIPLFARIISVVECYDRMTNMPDDGDQLKSRDEAIGEIRRCAGTQFDPEIAQAFIEMLQTCKDI